MEKQGENGVPAHSLLTTQVHKCTVRLRIVRVLTPWGKGCTDIRCMLQVARRGGVLAHIHPALYSFLIILTNKESILIVFTNMLDEIKLSLQHLKQNLQRSNVQHISWASNLVHTQHIASIQYNRTIIVGC